MFILQTSNKVNKVILSEYKRRTLVIIRLWVKTQKWVGLKDLKAGLIPYLSSPCSMTSPSANQKASLGLMMSCESNQRRLLAPLQWATEGMQRVILFGATQQQLCPCLFHLLVSILTRPLNCLSALMENNLSETDESSGCTTVSLCEQLGATPTLKLVDWMCLSIMSV